MSSPHPGATPSDPAEHAQAGDERPIRVLAVDDDPMVLDLIRVMLKVAPDLLLVGTASDGDAVIDACIRHRPDVVLLDVRMQRMNGIDACAALMKRPEPPRVVILTTFDDSEYVPRAMEAGAVGFILKSAARDELYAAIRSAHAGHSPMSAESVAHLRQGYLRSGGGSQAAARARLALLTPRELEVAQCVAQEQTNAEIARNLHLSEGSIKQHLSAIQAKLGASSRVGVATTVARATQ